LLEKPSPSRIILIGSHSMPPLWSPVQSFRFSWNHCFTFLKTMKGNNRRPIASLPTLMVKVLHNSRNYCRWELAFSLDLPQNRRMYHCDEASLDLEISSPGVDLMAGKNLVSRHG
jgi:hypothetical protein